MPLLELTTNTDIDDAQDIAKQASKLTADILGKPESYVMVKIQPKQDLIFAGTDEAAAHVKLKSLGLPEKETTEFSAKICDFISSELGINSARIYIEFSNPERHMWGWDGRTF
jgi:phenylpyruvate tautomerase PptA (4-oxalocrotonate tautomerase family)